MGHDLDRQKIPPAVKSEILYLLVIQAAPLPDLYPALLPILTEALTPESFGYSAAALSGIVEKAPEFAIVLSRVGALGLVYAAYASMEWGPVGNFAYLRLMSSLLRVRDTFLPKGFDWGRLAQCLTATDSSLATVSLEFVDLTAPASIPRVIATFGQFWQLLDAVAASMSHGRPEQIEAALKVLALLGKHCPKQIVQFTNEELVRIIVALLQSGIAKIQDRMLGFFDAFLATGEVALTPLSNWCLEFEDGGGREALLLIERGTGKEVGQHAGEVLRRIDEIEKAHRNRNRK
jgi:hypothetical protein